MWARPATAQARPATSSRSRTKVLDRALVLALHRALLGSEADIPASWACQGFTMRGSGLLVQHEGGPCGVLAAVQGFVVRELGVAAGAGGAVLCADREKFGDALVGALSHIVWSARVGRLASVVSCKRTSLPALAESDGALVSSECNSLDAVREAVRASAGSFVRPRGPGVAMLLYSVLLTRGVAMVARDADFASALIMPNGYCAQELVNLLLVGRAHSNVFDGERVVGDGDGGDGCGGARLRGIPRVAPIGFLTLFERQGDGTVAR